VIFYANKFFNLNKKIIFEKNALKSTLNEFGIFFTETKSLEVDNSLRVDMSVIVINIVNNDFVCDITHTFKIYINDKKFK